MVGRDLKNMDKILELISKSKPDLVSKAFLKRDLKSIVEFSAKLLDILQKQEYTNEFIIFDTRLFINVNAGAISLDVSKKGELVTEVESPTPHQFLEDLVHTFTCMLLNIYEDKKDESVRQYVRELSIKFLEAIVADKLRKFKEIYGIK